MKLMAVDFGEKRVGIASTDESGEFALPRLTLANDAELLDKVIEFKIREGIERVVMGESRNFAGAPNEIMAAVENFKKNLEAAGIEVVLHPEIFTTMEARRLQGQTDLTDASAAALILKSYIDSGYNKAA
jgi:putative holliday junction resolvase